MNNVIDRIASQGRQGDTRLAHMTPGEIVIPREIAAMRPDLVRHVGQAIQQAGGTPRNYMAGSGRMNPQTGLEEFATSDEIQAAYKQYLGRDADPEGLAFWQANPDGFSGGDFQKSAQTEIAGRTPAPAPAPTVAPVSNVADWYRNTAGRDADAGGLTYWTDRAKTVGGQGAYGEFVTSLQGNGEMVKPTDYAGANKAYTGFFSQLGNSNVDDWARNEFGREATPDEIARFGSATNPTDAQANYSAFLAAGTAGGKKARNLGLVGASQLTPAAKAPTMQPAPIQNATHWDVQPNQTVANQLENVLKNDSPLMQLARTRALQQMNRSGTVNSSMAATAGEAAMIDKALPIATQDASTYANAGQFNAGAENTFSRDSNQFSREQEMANFNVGANDWAADRGLSRDITRDNNANANAIARDAAGNAINTTRDSTAEDATLRRGYISALNQARTDYAQNLAAISSSTNMDAGLKTQTLTNLKTTYNTIIANYAKLLGWDAASWLIADTPLTTPTPTPAPTPPDV